MSVLDLTDYHDDERAAGEASGAIEAGGATDTDIVCPFTGEIIDPTDVDSLADLLLKCNEVNDAIQAAKLHIRNAMAALTTGDKKTRRVAGHRHTVVVTMPSDYWDQSILREAYEAYPGQRDKYLRIERLAPRLVEVKKLLGTNGPPDMNSLRDMLAAANKGPSGTPTVKVEK